MWIRTCWIVVSGALAYACAPEASTPAERAPRARCELAPDRGDEPTARTFVRAGSELVRKARARSEPSLHRNAEACVREALAREPDDRAALRLRGVLLVNDHRFEEARDLAIRLLALDDADALSWGTLSDAYLELGQLDAATDAAQRMLDLEPSLPSYGRAAHLRWLRGDVSGAKRLYELAIASGRGQRDPEPRAWMIVQAAWVFWHEGDYLGADAGFDLALRELSGYAPALEGKGRAALASGDPRAAIRWLDRAHRARPLPETAWALGDAYALAGEAERARRYYAELERDAERSDPRVLALYYAVRDRERERALALARREYAQRGDLYTKDVLAFAAFRAGLWPEADRLAAQLLEAGLPDARLRYRAGLIRSVAAGDPADRAAGEAAMRAALRANPGFDRLWTGGRDVIARGQN